MVRSFSRNEVSYKSTSYKCTLAVTILILLAVVLYFEVLELLPFYDFPHQISPINPAESIENRQRMNFLHAVQSFDIAFCIRKTTVRAVQFALGE